MKTGHYPSKKIKKIAQIKDELDGKIMAEFVVLRAKMYAYRKIDKEVEEKRRKGTKKCVVSEGIITVYREQMLFENKKHEVCTVNKHKIALNRDADKRIVQANGITTLARGNVALPVDNHHRCFHNH